MSSLGSSRAASKNEKVNVALKYVAQSRRGQGRVGTQSWICRLCGLSRSGNKERKTAHFLNCHKELKRISVMGQLFFRMVYVFLSLVILRLYRFTLYSASWDGFGHADRAVH